MMLDGFPKRQTQSRHFSVSHPSATSIGLTIKSELQNMVQEASHDRALPTSSHALRALHAQLWMMFPVSKPQHPATPSTQNMFPQMSGNACSTLEVQLLHELLREAFLGHLEGPPLLPSEHLHTLIMLCPQACLPACLPAEQAHCGFSFLRWKEKDGGWRKKEEGRRKEGFLC